LQIYKLLRFKIIWSSSFVQNLWTLLKNGVIQKKSKFDFLPELRFLTQISIFDPNFDFWPNLRFLTKISISVEIWICHQIFDSDQNLQEWTSYYNKKTASKNSRHDQRKIFMIDKLQLFFYAFVATNCKKRNRHLINLSTRRSLSISDIFKQKIFSADFHQKRSKKIIFHMIRCTVNSRWTDFRTFLL